MKRASNKQSAELTELEGNVLGLFAVGGPCTAYAIRREFRDSPSQHWSASAGAIYPLILRMHQRGLLRVTGTTKDGRQGKLYELTTTGRRALIAWINPACLTTVASVPPDPLRNRIALLGLLSRAEQARFLDGAVKHVRAHIEEVRCYLERKMEVGNTMEQLSGRGALRMLEARLDWLLETARLLDIKIAE